MKEKIIEIALQQFLKHGIRKMTVQKLTGPLGVSTKTVYNFFNNKEFSGDYPYLTDTSLPMDNTTRWTFVGVERIIITF